MTEHKVQPSALGLGSLSKSGEDLFRGMSCYEDVIWFYLDTWGGGFFLFV